MNLIENLKMLLYTLWMKNEYLLSPYVNIHEGFESIIKSTAKTGLIGQETVVHINSIFDLKYTLTGQEVLMAKLYLARPQSDAVAYLPGRSQYVLTPEQISLLKLTFDLQRTKVCPIMSLAVTRPEFEGRGIATALNLERDQIIQDVLKRHKDRFTGRHVYSEIIDMAIPNGVDKPSRLTGWSSRIATKLGYELFDPYGPFKIYRKDF